mgnify:CR=1 FL=1
MLMLIPMSVMLPDPPRPQRVTGIDLGLRFLAVSYDATATPVSIRERR